MYPSSEPSDDERAFWAWLDELIKKSQSQSQSQLQVPKHYMGTGFRWRMREGKRP